MLSAKRGRSVTGAAASQLAGARAVRPPCQQRREHGAEQLAALAEGGLHLVRVRARARVRVRVRVRVRPAAPTVAAAARPTRPAAIART